MESQHNQSFWNGSPKAMFLMGLFLGLAITSMIGLGVALSFVMSGKGLAAGTNLAVNNPTPSAADPSAVAPTNFKPVKEVDEATDHIRGPKDAKVTLIEYSDFECPFCQRHDPTLKQLLQKFPKDVRLVYRNYPLTFIHPNAQAAAEAAECGTIVGGNDGFWKMHDKLFDKKVFGRDNYISMAKEAGLDEAKFTKCIDSGDGKAKVAADTASGNDSGVDGTPATFVNGQAVSGAVPYEQMEQMVMQAGAKE